MEYRNATSQEHAVIRHLIDAIGSALVETCPDEDSYPGVTGLIVTALICVAGDLLQGVPEPHRSAVVAQYQEYLAKAAGERPVAH